MIALTFLMGLVIPLLLISMQATDTDDYFDSAENAIEHYEPPKKNRVVVIDYRKSLFSTRLYLLDMVNRKVILSSTVSHAWNSGFLWPAEWSNVLGSEKSSPGVYLTQEIYTGKFGKSMRIQGLDKGLNDNARSRAIVFHATPYYLPFWSKGCFETDLETNSRIIDLVAGGTLVCVIH